MTLRLETDRLRRVLSASLPTGARGAELFIESRVTLQIAIDPDSQPRVEQRWECGAHLRRFFEGRDESFVLDDPTSESLEALALHPESLSVEWLDRGARVGVPPVRADAGLSTTIEAFMSDASPQTPGGPWSDRMLADATCLMEGWLGSLGSRCTGLGLRLESSVSLEAQSQEILVLATDRDPARDTRTFVDATLRGRDLRPGAPGPLRAFTERRSGATLAALAEAGLPAAETLSARLCRAREAVASVSGEMPVVFASPSGGFLLHEICGHLLEADHVLRGASPFVGARGRAVSAPILTMVDDGSIPGMRGSALFDDEGVAARRTPLIMEGTLVGYLSDRMTAYATEGISTGNGRRQSYRDRPMPRMTNLVIEPGSESFESIVSGTPAGLLVTRLGRGRVDPATGLFALAVEDGFLIEGGRIGRPVSGAVLRGRAFELLPVIDAVGSDPAVDAGSPLCIKEDQALPFGIRQPTLRVATMRVAGSGR